MSANVSARSVELIADVETRDRDVQRDRRLELEQCELAHAVSRLRTGLEVSEHRCALTIAQPATPFVKVKFSRPRDGRGKTIRRKHGVKPSEAPSASAGADAAHHVEEQVDHRLCGTPPQHERGTSPF